MNEESCKIEKARKVCFMSGLILISVTNRSNNQMNWIVFDAFRS